VKRNRVRIVGGKWRSRMLTFPDAVGLRPTPDRVRETVFNWLGQSLDGKSCLDLFAGSGALGFEALSRGAKPVVMVEQNLKVARALRDNAAVLGAEALEFVTADALKFISRETRKFDIVFVDPPYALRLLPAILPGLEACLAQGGMIYGEADAEFDPGPAWDMWRSGRAGQVHYFLLKKAIRSDA
jgi:16S rRNA (guanine966-N2)-methyltransferase